MGDRISQHSQCKVVGSVAPLNALSGAAYAANVAPTSSAILNVGKGLFATPAGSAR